MGEGHIVRPGAPQPRVRLNMQPLVDLINGRHKETLEILGDTREILKKLLGAQERLAESLEGLVRVIERDQETTQ